MSDVTRFSFPLSQRMRSFLELRDGLRCLLRAEQAQHSYGWLLAAIDLRSSLLGDGGRRPAIPDLLGLLVAMQTQLGRLAEEHPQYRDKILASCEELDGHVHQLRGEVQAALDYLSNDALINVYEDAHKKQDWLGHKPGIPQATDPLWRGGQRRRDQLHAHLEPIRAAVTEFDDMLHNYVGWERRTASDGVDQIMPSRDTEYGLAVIGLAENSVAKGLMPDISGNRMVIRLRFQRWPSGESSRDVSEDVPYGLMLVPVA